MTKSTTLRTSVTSVGLASALLMLAAALAFQPVARAAQAEPAPSPGRAAVGESVAAPASGPAAAAPVGAPAGAPAQPTAAELYRESDLAQGEVLIREHGCNGCHVRHVGGDGVAIYRPQGRINTPGLLRGMVEYCNTQLNLQLFPEDVTSISAVLNRDHYHFK